VVGEAPTPLFILKFIPEREREKHYDTSSDGKSSSIVERERELVAEINLPLRGGHRHTSPW